MRFSNIFAPTLRELSSDVEMTSHRLLLRAGFIRQLSAGVYTFMPLGWKVIDNISNIIRTEMNRYNAQELHMPAMTPQELWQESGREANMAEILLGFKDRKGAQFYLGPTHEEVITDLVRKNVRSYRELPLNLYQIQMKFRDEPRPRGGVIRAREFLMKDAYSFDRDEDGLNETYDNMFDAYSRIYKRCGLDMTPVDASGGAIGGKETKEFMLVTDAGEDSIFLCPKCNYAANREIAEFAYPEAAESNAPAGTMAKIATPDAHTIQQVCDFLKAKPHKLVKTLIYMADGKPVAALVRGDRELNEGRFKVLVGAHKLEMATPEEIQQHTGAPVGFSGPVGLQIPIYADEELRGMVNFITGANENDMHLVKVNWSDVAAEITWSRLRFAEEGDICPCGSKFEIKRGMELGHIFKLRYAISEPMNATFTDEDGTDKLFIMGCYGIGVSRIMAAVAEVSNDENGLIWPMSLAPYKVHLIVANAGDEIQLAVANKIYKELISTGVDIVFDDRSERAGVKFKDADLMGMPIQIVVGKFAAEGQVEMRDRAMKNSRNIAVDEIAGEVKTIISDSLRNLE